MKENTIIARAVRNLPDGIAEVKLVWLTHYSKLSVEYRQMNTGEPFISYAVPDHCVSHWLKVFIRDQVTLQADSYFIIEKPVRQWEDVLRDLLDMPRSTNSVYDEVMLTARTQVARGHKVMILVPNSKMVREIVYRYDDFTSFYGDDNMWVRATTIESSLKSLPLDTIILVGQNHQDWNTPGEKANLDHLRYHQDWNTSGEESNLISMSPNLWTYDTAVYDTGNHRWDKELGFMANFVIGWHLPVVYAAHPPRVTTRQLRVYLWRCLWCGPYSHLFKLMIQVDSEYYVL